ncbi:MAG: NAD(P)H-dependent nitrite reductase catalytic subunit [Pedosphaera sp.]|nr:NAD(P)H-dependent nitrite reductase catalytic subunit [Pedosphaera sp.]
MSTSLPEPLDGAGFSSEQKEYLTGMFAGIAARGMRFSDVEPAPGAVAKNEDLIFEERVKRELHPLDAYPQLVENAIGNKAPDKEDAFRFKWNGLFFLTPVKDSFMARLRIPGGVVKTFQLRQLGRIAQELTTGYVQITTRANFQMRLIQPKDAPEFLRRVQCIGLHTRGSGADNIRNLTANPTAGIDPVELIDVLPFVHDLAQIIINDRSFYDLPRKFNIAYDGGGFIGAVEDTNDIGVKAVKVGEEVLFRVALGGATGHKAFARDLGVVVQPAQINKVVTAIVRVFIERGCRTDRKRARLKHLLETVPLTEYLALVENKLGEQLRREPYEPAKLRWASQELPHSHIGDFPQKQIGLNYVGVGLPVGQITPKQMIRLADLVEAHGGDEIRLTVWQNFIIPNVPDEAVPELKRALEKLEFSTRQSNVASGIIACTGNSYCKFAQSDTKGHALELMKWLEKRVQLDQPINIHLTGCPNSCAQHYMGDIGCLGIKTKVGGQSVDGYHIFVGGGFAGHQAVGRQLFSGVAAGDLPRTLETMLRAFLKHRQGRETFQKFTTRQSVNELQVVFTNQS